MATLKPADSHILIRAVVSLASSLIFLLSPVVLLGTVWWGVSFHRLEKMEAWWWLSAPFSMAFPISMATFQMWEFGHPLALFIVFFYICFLSSTIYQLTVSKTSTINPRNTAMMAVVVLAGILLFSLGR
jgi:hypothetical protein